MIGKKKTKLKMWKTTPKCQRNHDITRSLFSSDWSWRLHSPGSEAPKNWLVVEKTKPSEKWNNDHLVGGL
jgi:hypothetical protein